MKNVFVLRISLPPARARDLRLKRDVAIKVLLADVTFDLDQLARGYSF